MTFACRGARDATEPVPPYSHARELAHLLDAIEDLGHAEVAAWDTQTTRELLRNTFVTLCKGERISCEESAWTKPWVNQGDSGQILAHALADLDSVYMVFSRQRGERYVFPAADDIDLARRQVRTLLFRRERIGMKHLPEARQQLMAIADLEYARSLFADELPPASVPWDRDQALEALDAALAVYRSAGLDPAPPKETFKPTPADFKSLSYAERIIVAHDLVVRAIQDLNKAPDLSEDRGVMYRLSVNLRSARDHLSSVERFRDVREVPVHAPRSAGREAVLGILLRATNHAGGNFHTAETQPHEEAARRAIRDAFLALCKVSNFPADDSRKRTEWAQREEPTSLELAQAMLEQERSGDFSKVIAHIESAREAMRQLDVITRHLNTVDARSYVFLRDALDGARVLLSSAAPSNHPWDVEGTLANLGSAITAIDRARLDPDKKPWRGSAIGLEAVPYWLRVHIARNLIARELREVEGFRGKGPREALAPARAALATIEGALGSSVAASSVNAQAAAQRR